VPARVEEGWAAGRMPPVDDDIDTDDGDDA
jgi:hypothetical protein